MKKNFVRSFSWSLLAAVVLTVSLLIIRQGHEFAIVYSEGDLEKLLVVIGIGLAVLAVLLFWFKFQLTWFKDASLRKIIEKWPVDVRLMLLFITACFLYLFIGSSKNAVYYGIIRYGGFQSIENTVFTLLLLTICLWAGIYQAIWMYEEMQDGDSFNSKLQEGLAASAMRSAKDAFAKTSIGVSVLLVTVVVFFWGMGTALAFTAPELLPFYIVCVLFIGIPSLLFLLIRIGYLNKVFTAAGQMASGRKREPVAVKGKSSIAKHAANLNKLQEGIQHSANEQAKSERLKTELITNVSHDLRTPLTSIITYTDLLKNPSLTEEERADYVSVLDHKSQRLKTLIEDLFEVSKMASGNLELVRQRVDLNQLLQQAMAEHEAEMEQAEFSFRVTTPETPVFAFVDGNRWWRMLDNLIGNALKYTLPGTRVFITLKEENKEAEFTIKNVTKYELEENIDELLERFKRADSSRHTEGSGLGLAIAQSIIDLHGGRMHIEIDGDLFKVTVRIAAS